MSEAMTIWVECVVCAKRQPMRSRVWAAAWAQHASWLCPGCVQAHIATMALNGACLVLRSPESLTYQLEDRTQVCFAIIDPERTQPAWSSS